MHIKDNIQNFIYDKDYFISIYPKYIHLFNYISIEKFLSDLIIIKFSGFDLKLTGKDFLIIKMIKNEILIQGEIKGIDMIYE